MTESREEARPSEELTEEQADQVGGGILPYVEQDNLFRQPEPRPQSEGPGGPGRREP